MGKYWRVWCKPSDFEILSVYDLEHTAAPRHSGTHKAAGILITWGTDARRILPWQILSLDQVATHSFPCSCSAPWNNHRNFSRRCDQIWSGTEHWSLIVIPISHLIYSENLKFVRLLGLKSHLLGLFKGFGLRREEKKKKEKEKRKKERKRKKGKAPWSPDNLGTMRWLRWIGSLKTKVSFAKEHYKRDLYSAKETYNSKEPTKCSHPILNSNRADFWEILISLGKLRSELTWENNFSKVSFY